MAQKRIIDDEWVDGLPLITGQIRKNAGAAEGIRTPDPRITNAVLYRLSYRG
jgi:hypothetical protein